MQRIQFHPFWKVTDWGLPFIKDEDFGRLRLIGRGGDEWGNPSIYLIVPLVGMVVVFYTRNFDRTGWYHFGSSGQESHYSSPDHNFVATLPRGHVDPQVLTHAQVFAHANIVEPIDEFFDDAVIVEAVDVAALEALDAIEEDWAYRLRVWWEWRRFLLGERLARRGIHIDTARPLVLWPFITVRHDNDDNKETPMFGMTTKTPLNPALARALAHDTNLLPEQVQYEALDALANDVTLAAFVEGLRGPEND